MGLALLLAALVRGLQGGQACNQVGRLRGEAQAYEHKQVWLRERNCTTVLYCNCTTVPYRNCTRVLYHNCATVLYRNCTTVLYRKTNQSHHTLHCLPVFNLSTSLQSVDCMSAPHLPTQHDIIKFTQYDVNKSPSMT